jgi:RimJ/RimL family protein N-acetyltransferase
VIKLSTIEYAFKDDNEINKYCDADYKDASINELVLSIYNKLLEHEEYGTCKFVELIIDNELIGFFFCFKHLLVSFGINKKYRNKETLTKVFNIIKNEFNSDFECYMWERNIRAINWLKKCGMAEDICHMENVKKLKFSICH